MTVNVGAATSGGSRRLWRIGAYETPEARSMTSHGLHIQGGGR
jgi:hypothetical protein